MDFEKTIKRELGEKYIDMLNDKSSAPCQDLPKIGSHKTYSVKRRNYYNRLENEKETFAEALKTIEETKTTRLRREANAIQAKKARQMMRKERIKQAFITLLMSAPVAFFLLWAYTMLNEPLTAFKSLHFGWVIAIYVVAFLVFFFVSFGVEYVHRKVILILGSIAFVVLMIVGMTSIPEDLIISNTSDFEAIMNIPGAGSRNYELAADIDFGGETSKCWGKIKDFTGTFNGNNHTIKNLTIEAKSSKLKCGTVYISESNQSNETTSAVGLGFVQKNNGVIENVRFDQIDIITPQDAYQFIGVVAAYNAGKINNCLVTNCTISTKNNGIGLCYVGGIVGYDNSGEISNVAFINTEDEVVFDIKSTNCYFGGIAGESYAADIKNVYVYQKNKSADRYGGVLGVVEALNAVYWGEDIPAYLTNCVNCFAPVAIYAYGMSVQPIVQESNVVTLDSAAKDLSELPEEMRDWTYLSDLGCYVPCSNFK